MGKSKVYFTKEISSEGLLKVYEALNVNLSGKVGVKVSTGEKGSKGYLKADLIKPLVEKVNGTIIECNTAYNGQRNTYEDHIVVAKEHGFDFAPIDIMDKDEEFKIPVKNGNHLKYDIIGKNFENYDSIINLAHGKGHPMGGFGANLKNQSIGIASRNGKAYIHSCGQTIDPNECWSAKYEQKEFIESMAEAANAVSDYLKDNNKQIVYITVMNYLSLDCDCVSTQREPVMEDLGIVASLDPVANDQAFIDMIFAKTDAGAKKLQHHIDSKEGRHILEYASELGLGSTEYELIDIDDKNKEVKKGEKNNTFILSIFPILMTILSIFSLIYGEILLFPFAALLNYIGNIIIGMLCVSLIFFLLVYIMVKVLRKIYNSNTSWKLPLCISFVPLLTTLGFGIIFGITSTYLALAMYVVFFSNVISLALCLVYQIALIYIIRDYEN